MWYTHLKLILKSQAQHFLNSSKILPLDLSSFYMKNTTLDLQEIQPT